MKTVKRVASITALAAAGVAMFPTVASAHHPSASDSCEGLSVDMTSYPGPGTPNHLTVTIDDVVVLDTAFGESFSETFPWSQTVDHHWVVVVDGLTPDGDAKFTGSEYACQDETTTTPTTEAPTSTEETPTTEMVLVSPASVATTSTVDTTTTVVSETPVAPETTTTTQVASLAPTAPPSSTAGVAAANVAPSGDVLPATGSRSVAPTLLLGSFLVLVGSVLAMVKRRSRHV